MLSHHGSTILYNLSKVEPIIQQNGATSLLITLNDFGGWDDDSGDWSDLSFGERNDRYLNKMAIVGDLEWKTSVEMFTLKGLWKIPIYYFLHGQEELAIAWLA